MAQLKSRNLTLEIAFTKFEDEWIAYLIKFLWQNDNIINDNILKKTGWYGKREPSTFLANDYERDHLIETIRKAISTYKPQGWEPMEPDAKLGIYPMRYFPFVETNYNLFEELEEIRLNTKNHEDTDLFTIIFYIDTYNFKDTIAYSSDGISIHMVVTRKDLEKFADDLENDLSKFI